MSSSFDFPKHILKKVLQGGDKNISNEIKVVFHKTYRSAYNSKKYYDYYYGVFI